MITIRILKLWLFALLIVVQQIAAGDYYWTNNGTSGNFADAANWMKDGGPAPGPPGEGDTALFTNAENFTVNWSADATVANAYFNATGGTATLNIGAANTWFITDNFIVGQNSATAQVTLASGNLVVTNAAKAGTMIVGQSVQGVFAITAGVLAVNRLLATNNALDGLTNSTFKFNGGTLVTRSAPDDIAANVVVQSNQNFSNPGNYDIKGSWTMLGGTNIINMLYVDPGYVKGYIYVGGSALAPSGTNTITVATGAVWHVIAGNPYLNAANNTIRLLDGGRAYFPKMGIGGTSNSLQVVGSGSLFTVQSNGLSVGGSCASVVVSNGGAAYISGGGTINGLGSLIVTGPGSILTNSAAMFIGLSSHSNNMIIADGGTIVVPNMPVGGGGGQTYYGNTLTVTGPGSSLTNLTGSLYLGDTGTEDGSRVIVSNGGRIVNATLGTSIGQGSLTNRNNSVVVTGSGSVLTNFTGMVVAQYGWSNRLLVADGGQVLATYCTVANYATASNNSFTISGAGSTGKFSGAVTVGNASNCNFNGMVVSNGAVVENVNGYIGKVPFAFSNTVTVAGSGAEWRLGNGALIVGSASNAGNALSVFAGGIVTNVNTLTIAAGNSVNLYGGTVVATSLAMQAEAQLGVAVATPGILRVTGNATVDGYVCPAYFPKKGITVCTILTCAGTLSGGLSLGPLPEGYTGSITTNLLSDPKQIDLMIKGPPEGINMMFIAR